MAKGIVSLLRDNVRSEDESWDEYLESSERGEWGFADYAIQSLVASPREMDDSDPCWSCGYLPNVLYVGGANLPLEGLEQIPYAITEGVAFFNADENAIDAPAPWDSDPSFYENWATAVKHEGSVAGVYLNSAQRFMICSVEKLQKWHDMWLEYKEQVLALYNVSYQKVFTSQPEVLLRLENLAYLAELWRQVMEGAIFGKTEEDPDVLRLVEQEMLNRLNEMVEIGVILDEQRHGPSWG